MKNQPAGTPYPGNTEHSIRGRKKESSSAASFPLFNLQFSIPIQQTHSSNSYSSCRHEANKYSIPKLILSSFNGLFCFIMVKKVTLIIKKSDPNHSLEIQKWSDYYADCKNQKGVIKVQYFQFIYHSFTIFSNKRISNDSWDIRSIFIIFTRPYIWYSIFVCAYTDLCTKSNKILLEYCKNSM